MPGKALERKSTGSANWKTSHHQSFQRLSVGISVAVEPLWTAETVRPNMDAMPSMMRRASRILNEYGAAQSELIGKAVVLTDGKAGTVESVWLDDLHGLRIAIEGHDGRWQVSTIKLAES
jgi:hypothetical protein